VYSARTGLDLTTDPVVNEYIIGSDADQTPFRYWGTPFTGNTTTATQRSGARFLNEPPYKVEFDGCYTALTFTASDIANQAFNLSSTDKMIWAANNMDSFMQYHGANRGVFEIDWSQGKTGNAAPSNTASNTGGGSTSTSSTSDVVSIQKTAAMLVALSAALF
jgi:hypothetical protein